MLAAMLAQFLRRQSVLSLGLSGIVFILVAGLLDYVTGAETSLEAFYLVPVFLTALFAGWPAGIVTAFVAAITVILVDALSGRAYAHPAIPYWNGAVTTTIFLITARTGSALKHALERQHDLARMDDLTGAANRRAFGETAENEIHRARRSGRPLSVAYIDLDNFKTINDRLGHSTGDRLLCLVTEVIRRNIRAVDALARLGGDEFTLLLPETDRQAARLVMERILRQLADAMQKESWPVSASIGLVTFTRPPESVDELLRQADDLMYVAKHGGKNQLSQNVIGEAAQFVERRENPK